MAQSSGSKTDFLKEWALTWLLVIFPVAVPSRPLTPEKFSVPHICARFGPGGYLIKVLPNLPSEGQPTLVEICSMEVSEKQE